MNKFKFLCCVLIFLIIFNIPVFVYASDSSSFPIIPDASSAAFPITETVILANWQAYVERNGLPGEYDSLHYIVMFDSSTYLYYFYYSFDTFKNYEDSSLYLCGGDYFYQVRCFDDGRIYDTYSSDSYISLTLPTHVILYCSDDVYGGNLNNLDILYIDGVAESFTPGDGFEFTPKNDLVNYDEKNDHINSSIQSESLSESASSDSNVFLRIFQGISDLLNNVGKTVTNINQWLADFVNNFFNNYVPNVVQNGIDGIKDLLSQILNKIGEAAIDVFPDNLLDMIGQLYDSGLDANGTFSLSSMFQYWLVPDVGSTVDGLWNGLDKDSNIGLVLNFADSLKTRLLELEPVAPIFTIPANTYGFLTFKEDIVIDFSWFADWKTYTDPLIAAFLYFTYFWHLFMQIPGILSGSAATAYVVQRHEERAVRNERTHGKG